MNEVMLLYQSIRGTMPRGEDERAEWYKGFLAFQIAYNRALLRGPIDAKRVRFLALLSKCNRGNPRKRIQSRRPKLPY